MDTCLIMWTKYLLPGRQRLIRAMARIDCNSARAAEETICSLPRGSAAHWPAHSTKSQGNMVHKAKCQAGRSGSVESATGPINRQVVVP